MEFGYWIVTCRLDVSTVFDLYSVGDGMLLCMYSFTYESGLIANCSLLK